MEIIYSGKELKRILSESIAGYKPITMGDAMSKSKDLNTRSNKESLKNVKLNISNEDFKPVKANGQSTDIGNNKNMLDIQFDVDPGKEYKERVKKQVTGENSEFGNASEDKEANKGNKEFYKAAKNGAKDYVERKQKLNNSGIVGRSVPVGKKETPFSEKIDKVKKLNFKNTKFLNEKHILSLVPEDYKKDGNRFVMKDCNHDEYLIEWKIENGIKGSKAPVSEGIIVKYENKIKLEEDFKRIKELYSYKSSDYNVSLTNKDKVNEDYSVLAKNIKMLKENYTGDNTEQIPTWSLTYLTRGSAEGLNYEEMYTVRNWMAKNGVDRVEIPSEGIQEYFSETPAFGEPTNVKDCKVVYVDYKDNVYEEFNPNNKSEEPIPTWALGYLINGDATGLEDEELEIIKTWIEKNNVYDVASPSGDESQPYFSYYPAFGKASEVEDCTVFFK